MKLPIYMDNHATTPLDPRVLEAMMPYFTEKFGNAASRNHTFGFEAEAAVEEARRQVAALIGADHREIVFTSGATESDNLAVKGVATMYREHGDHIITCVTEHKAILDSCKHLEKEGFKVTFLPVDNKGFVNLDELRATITDQTILVSIMTANNEVGVVQDVKAIGEIVREARGKRPIPLFHTDAVQAAGKIPFNVNDMNVDLASLSAHKMYGPKGVGALYVRRRNPRVLVTPIIDGGGHERGMRSGTLNVPGIVGFGKAAQIAREELDKEIAEMFRLRERLRATLERELDEIYINGDLEKRLPGNLNMSFAYVEGESLLMGIHDVAVSSGSACTSASLEPSYVLKALGVGEDLAHTSIRFGIGRFNTEEEVDYVAKRVIEVVQRLRELSPLYEMAKEGIDLKSVNWAAAEQH